jgi:hypothetical protein
MASTFTYSLMYADGEPCDPGAFATTELRWSVGDTVLIRPARNLRIVDVQPPSAYGAELDLTAIWTVIEA